MAFLDSTPESTRPFVVGAGTRAPTLTGEALQRQAVTSISDALARPWRLVRQAVALSAVTSGAVLLVLPLSPAWSPVAGAGGVGAAATAVTAVVGAVLLVGGLALGVGPLVEGVRLTRSLQTWLGRTSTPPSLGTLLGTVGILRIVGCAVLLLGALAQALLALLDGGGGVWQALAVLVPVLVAAALLAVGTWRLQQGLRGRGPRSTATDGSGGGFAPAASTLSPAGGPAAGGPPLGGVRPSDSPWPLSPTAPIEWRGAAPMPAAPAAPGAPAAHQATHQAAPSPAPAPPPPLPPASFEPPAPPAPAAGHAAGHAFQLPATPPPPAPSWQPQAAPPVEEMAPPVEETVRRSDLPGLTPVVVTLGADGDGDGGQEAATPDARIEPGTWLVGRAPTPRPDGGEAQPLTVTDPGVSKTHLLLEVGTHQVTVTDRASTNGTTVLWSGGRRRLEPWEPALVGPGEQVVLGGLRLTVEPRPATGAAPSAHQAPDATGDVVG